MADARTDPQYKLRLPAGLKALIDKKAEESGRSINQEIIFRLTQAYAFGPDVEAGKLQDRLTREAFESLTRAITNAERQLNMVMLHVRRGDHPDTWGDVEPFRGWKSDALFEAAREYADELGPMMPMTDVLFMCAERWLEHVGRLPAKGAEGEGEKG